MKMIFFALLFIFSGSLKSYAQEKNLDQIVVIVNNEIILESDIIAFQKQLAKKESVDENFGITYEQVKSSRKNQIDYLILQKLIDSEIKKSNLTASAERVDQEIRDLAKRNRISVNEILEAIKAEGFTTESYKSFIKNQIEKRNLFDSEIISKLKISEEEIKNEYYKKNKKHQGEFNEFSLAHIFINPKKGGDANALKRAQNTLEKIKSGTTFEQAAEQFSEDPNFNNGGFLGTFKSGESIPELENAVNKIEVGNYSDIIKTKAGYHIIKLLDKKATNDPEFNKQKDQIRAMLLEKNFSKQLKTWINLKKEEAFIKYNL